MFFVNAENTSEKKFFQFYEAIFFKEENVSYVGRPIFRIKKFHNTNIEIKKDQKLANNSFKVHTNGNVPCKTNVTHNIFAHNIEIKRHFDKKIFFRQKL